MPCVLPVLSIKLLSVVNHGGRDRGAVRASFLASAAGIVASFLVLAGVAVALKGLGMTVGWGIQFQQPYQDIFVYFALLFPAVDFVWSLTNRRHRSLHDYLLRTWVLEAR